MAHYHIRPLELRAFASHESLLMIASFDAKAEASSRQRTIDYLVRQHGINLATTKSLRYDSTLLTKAGVNLKGDIRIGPMAFAQGHCWLANVVFHEAIHSDQFHFYAQHKIELRNYPADSEPVRVQIALDEFEGFFWVWRNGRSLGLSAAQMAEMEREVRLWQIEIDDAETLQFVRTANFNDARLALFKRLGTK